MHISPAGASTYVRAWIADAPGRGANRPAVSDELTQGGIIQSTRRLPAATVHQSRRVPMTYLRPRAMCFCLTLLATLYANVSHAAGLPRELFSNGLPSLAPMVEEVQPAVVNIATLTNVQVRNPLLEDPFFRRFFNVPEARRYRQTQSAGSGVIIDGERGYIVTNNHVIERADEIAVTLNDGRTVPARLVGRDAQVDIALLQVEAQGLNGMPIGDSAAMRVGDFVVAIGNPFGIGQTVTGGMVSGVGRTGLGLEGYEDLIQTDAPINPGNSGGALVNLAGELVGINTAILSPSGGSIGIGFSIPSNVVSAIAAQLIEHGEVRRGEIGLSVQALNPDLAAAFGADRSQGVVVVEVQPGSAADRAGIREGDILVSINGREINRPSAYHSMAAVMMVGDAAEVTVLRDGRRRSLHLEIAEDSYEIVPGERMHPLLKGAELQNHRSSSDPDVGAGVVVEGMEPGSLAWRYGLREGDIIVAVNQRAVQNLSDMRAAIEPRARQVLLRIFRNGVYGYLTLQ